MKVFWSVLLERSVMDSAVNSLLDVATTTATLNAQRLSVEYGRVDISRNALVTAFLEQSAGEDDVLVMLDNDMVHPPDVIVKLVEALMKKGAMYGVIGAAYRRRGEPFDWLAYQRQEPRVRPGVKYEGKGTIGRLVPITDEQITGEIVPVDVIATGAIAIRRSVFEVLRGVTPWPWFRYAYQNETTDAPSEDMYFCAVCEWAGVRMGCHTGIVSKHLRTVEV